MKKKLWLIPIFVILFAFVFALGAVATVTSHSANCAYCAEKGDMDGDGKVSLDDAIYLLYHVNFPASYPLAGCEDAEEPQPLFAGYAEREFTPTEMGGYMPGASYTAKAKEVQMPLSASAIALESGEEALILVSMDILWFAPTDTASMRERIAAATGIPGEKIMIAATHTHTGVALNVDFLPNKADEAVFNHATAMAVEAATAAWNSRSAGLMGNGITTLEGYSFCREAYLTDGTVKTWPTNASQIDRFISTPDQSVNVIRLDDTEGKVRGLVVNFVSHPDTSKKTGYNPDYPGYMRQVLKEEYGEDTVIVYLNGAEGDVNHHDYINSTSGGRNNKVIGEALGEKVIELVTTISATEKYPRLSSSSEIYDAPLRKPTQEQLSWAQEMLEYKESGGTVTSMNMKYVLEYTSHDYSVYGDTYELEIQTLVVGDFAMVCLPGEIYSEIGHQIKEGSPYEKTMVIGLANACHGYIPPDYLLGTDSYGARFSIHTSKSGEGTEGILVDNSLAMLEEMKN